MPIAKLQTAMHIANPHSPNTKKKKKTLIFFNNLSPLKERIIKNH
jgi:hypothetical protein